MRQLHDDQLGLFSLPPRHHPPTGQRRSAAEVGRGLGATLYLPTTRPDLDTDLRRLAEVGTTSVVLCCEDAVAARDLPRAEEHLLDLLTSPVAATPVRLPDQWLRPRSPQHLVRLQRRAGDHLGRLTGLVLPKVDARSVEAWDAALDEVSARSGGAAGWRPYLMPTVETPDAIYRETRASALDALSHLVDTRREQVAALRVGATDLSGLFGLRRRVDEHVYQVAVVADLIGDLVNTFARPEVDMVVTGPVWEFFPASDRRTVTHPAVVGLARETRLDLSNGLLGKTVVHPTQVPVVHAVSAVSHEEWTDATQVSSAGPDGGALASPSAEKMNESGPHARWAAAVLARAETYGVLKPQVTWRDLVQASPAFAARRPAPVRWPAPAS